MTDHGVPFPHNLAGQAVPKIKQKISGGFPIKRRAQTLKVSLELFSDALISKIPGNLPGGRVAQLASWVFRKITPVPGAHKAESK